MKNGSTIKTLSWTLRFNQKNRNYLTLKLQLPSLRLHHTLSCKPQEFSEKRCRKKKNILFHTLRNKQFYNMETN